MWAHRLWQSFFLFDFLTDNLHDISHGKLETAIYLIGWSWRCDGKLFFISHRNENHRRLKVRAQNGQMLILYCFIFMRKPRHVGQKFSKFSSCIVRIPNNLPPRQRVEFSPRGYLCQMCVKRICVLCSEQLEKCSRSVCNLDGKFAYIPARPCCPRPINPDASSNKTLRESCQSTRIISCLITVHM